MSEEFNNLKDKVSLNKQTLIDDYGSLCPAEFFAVVTETFFEQADQLKNKHPKLYQILSNFYQQDPASRKEKSHSKAKKDLFPLFESYFLIPHPQEL